MLTRTRHSPFTPTSPQPPGLTESQPYFSYPDSRRLYTEVYNPPYPILHPVPPQGHRSTHSFPPAIQTPFVHDGDGMGSLSLLHAHAPPRPNESEQAPEVAREEMRVEDEDVDEVTHTQCQSQPTALDTLLTVSNASGGEPIPRPVSAPPVFPHSGLESDRHDAEEEATIGSMTNPRDDGVGCYLPTNPALNHSALQPATTPCDYEEAQAQVLAELARMHNFTPRPELRPFPDSHPYLYYLFPPPPTAALVIQAVVHPTLVSINLTLKANPEITGTRGRRTAWSERDGMRVGEVKGPMYENVPLIDVRTGVVHYPGAGHTCVMTGGVRIGSCADEEEREVMELLEVMELDERKEEMERVAREDVQRPDTPISERPMPHLPSTPVRPLPPHLFDHHQHRAQNGYAYASPPDSPVHVRQATPTQYEYPQAVQQTPGVVVQPLHNSPIQHRRPSSHLANEYFPQQQPPYVPGTTTTTIEAPTPKMRPVYGYHPGYPASFSPAVYAVPMPPPSSPAPYMAPVPPSYVAANPYTPQPSPGPYVWYGVSAGGNAYTPAVADTNMNGYFHPPSVALAPGAQAPAQAPGAAPSLELGLSTTKPDSNNKPQVFYTEQELDLHFLKDPVLSVPAMPTLHAAPRRPKRGVKYAVGKAAMIGIDGNIVRGGYFATEEPPPEAPSHSYSYSHPDPTPVTAGIERPASVPPILEDDTMHGVEVEVEAGARANRKRKRDQLAWDYRQEKGDGGDEADEGVSDDEAAVSADERKRARIGQCGNARRRSFGDDEKRPGSSARTRLGY